MNQSIKRSKLLTPLLAAFISILVLVSVQNAFPFVLTPSGPIAGLDAGESAVSARGVPGNDGLLAPPHATTLAVRDFQTSSPVADASSDVSDAPDTQSIASRDGGKSKVKALALSTLLPGAGQYYAGKKGRANFFFLTESAIWTSFIVFEVQGHLRKNNYIDFAQLMAGVDAGGKPEDFYRALGRYMQTDPGPGSYNEDVRREARALYPDDKQKQDQYLQENGYFGKNAWQWQSEGDQAYYRSLRKNSQLSFRRATYMLGVAVANRVLSAMDAARSAASSTRSTKASQGLRFEMRNNPDSPGYFVVCLTRPF